MRLFRYLSDIPKFPEGSLVTIGNFDGFHRGHQALLARLKEKRETLKLPLVVMLFEPQPAEFFLKEQAPRRLSSFREKLEMLSKAGVDIVFCPRFNPSFSEISAEDFVSSFLFLGLNTRYLLVGEDFRFGKERQGNVDFLKEAAKQENREVEVLKPFMFQNEKISSTRVRQVISSGNLALAEKLLARPYTISGKVVYGDGRASAFGIPTANMVFQKSPALSGVFCVSVTLPDGRIASGVANVGTRPTFKGKRPVLEVHLFEIQENLYGQRLEVRFLKKLREEKTFSSVNELIEQIHNDIREARKMSLTFG